MSRELREERAFLMQKTRKCLLDIAKEEGVVGRHNMTKSDLVDALMRRGDGGSQLTFEEAIEQKLTHVNVNQKERYEKTTEVGMLVAFTIGEKMYSGKIIEIHANKFRVETRRGVRYLIDKKAVAWYKTGSRWPRGIYDELQKGRYLNVDGFEIGRRVPEITGNN